MNLRQLEYVDAVSRHRNLRTAPKHPITIRHRLLRARRCIAALDWDRLENERKVAHDAGGKS